MKVTFARYSRLLSLRWCGLFVFFVLGSFAVSAAPQVKQIAVIDYERVITKAPPFVHAANVFGEKRNKFYEELGELEKELSRENKELISLQKTDLEKFKKSKEAFEEKLKKAHEKLNKRKKTLLSIAEREQGEAQKKFKSALEKLAKKYKLDIVLPKTMMSTQLVLYSAPHLDLTDEVIQYMSAKESKYAK